MTRLDNIGEMVATALMPRSSLMLLSVTPLSTDVAAAIASLKTLHQIMLGARYCGWETEQDQLNQIVLRHAWAQWLKQKGDYSPQLNERVAHLVLTEWATENRTKITDTYRWKLLRVGHARYMTGLKDHYEKLLSWLDIETENALNEVSNKLVSK